MARLEYRAGKPAWVILGKKQPGHVLYVVFAVTENEGVWEVGKPLKAFHDLASKPVEVSSLDRSLLQSLSLQAEQVLDQAEIDEVAHDYREARSGVASLRDEAGRR